MYMDDHFNPYAFFDASAVHRRSSSGDFLKHPFLRCILGSIVDRFVTTSFAWYRSCHGDPDIPPKNLSWTLMSHFSTNSPFSWVIFHAWEACLPRSNLNGSEFGRRSRSDAPRIMTLRSLESSHIFAEFGLMYGGLSLTSSNVICKVPVPVAGGVPGGETWTCIKYSNAIFEFAKYIVIVHFVQR